MNIQYKQLENEYFALPILTCLKESEGKEDHTVAIYKGWIYDGHFPNALQLSKEALDICSLHDEKCGFVGLTQSYLFHLFQDYLKENNKGSYNEKKSFYSKLKNKQKDKIKKR